MDFGLMPSALLGHSLGEYVAAALAGVFTLEEGVKIIAERGRLVQQLPQGDMISLETDLTQLKPWLEGDLDIAGINSLKSIVVSGSREAVHRLKLRAQQEGVRSKRLFTSHAFHSRMLDPILDEFRSVMRQVELKPPNIPFLSNRHGDWAEKYGPDQADYWVNHLRGPVHFADCAARLLQEEAKRTFLEVWPGFVLSSLMHSLNEFTKGHKTLRSLPTGSDEDEVRRFFSLLGKFWEENALSDLSKLNPSARRLSLPGYPFEKKSYFVPRAVAPPGAKGGGEILRVATEKAAPQVKQKAATKPQPDKPLPKLEQETLQLWKDFLQQDDLSVQDDFFDLGGDSLMAIQLAAQLEKKFKLPLSGHVILQYPTPAKLAAALREQLYKDTGKTQRQARDLRQQLYKPIEESQSQKSFQFVVPLQQQGPGTPIFLFPTGGGFVLYYRDFVRRMGEEQPIFGFQARGLDGKEPPFERIESMASAFIEELVQLCPQGPCIIGGASFGGMVGYEVARQWVELGREVELLFLIDSPGPGQMPTRFDNNVMIIQELVGDALNLNLQELSLMSAEEQVNYVFEKARLANLPNLLPREFGIPFLTVTKAHMSAMFAYQPQALNQRLLYFRHSEPLQHYPSHPERPWVDLSQGNIDIRTIPGNHYTMNFNPHVNWIVQEIKRQISLRS